jgi:hypothetical protein
MYEGARATSPAASRPGWEDRPCLGTDLYLWFGPGEGEPAETPTERRWREMVAKGVCTQCPIRAACLADELRRPAAQQWGVRGGLTAGERRKLIRRNRRAAA